MTDFPLVIAACCREWPVALGQRIGRCGFCGERPVIDWTLSVPTVELPDAMEATSGNLAAQS
jgi:hypothetical protein